MATLLATFGKRDGPLEAAGDARTYSLTIGGSEQSMEVPTNCNVVTLLPDGNCWVAVGGDANAEHGTSRRPLVADVAKRFSVRPGQTLSVVQRS